MMLPLNITIFSDIPNNQHFFDVHELVTQNKHSAKSALHMKEEVLAFKQDAA